MDFFTIPVSDEVPAATFLTTLEGKQYRITYYWDNLLKTWYMDITGGGIDLRGLALLGGVFLTQAYGIDNLFGDMGLLDTTSRNQEPGRDTLGPTKTHRLLYRSRT